MTYVFSGNLPTGFLLVELLADTRWDTDDDIRLDGSQRGHWRSSWLGGKRTDSDGERRVERSVTVVGEFTVVEITLEDDQVGLREVLE